MDDNGSFVQAMAEWSCLPEGKNGIFAGPEEKAIAQPLKRPTYSEALRCLSSCLCEELPADRFAHVRQFLCCSHPFEFQLQQQKTEILRLTQVSLDNSNEVHVAMLLELYRHLRGETRAFAKRFGPHWETIGFQGVDPATDLRGVGIFGLLQLFYLASCESYQGWVTSLYRLSLDPLQQFPFCLVGLNLTRLVVNQLRRGQLDRFSRQTGNTVLVANQLFAGIFRRFGQLWTEGNRTIADSGGTLKEVENFLMRQPRAALKLANQTPDGKINRLKSTPAEHPIIDFTPI